MSFFDEVGDDFDGVERRAESGGQIPAGFYRVKLDGAKEHVSARNETPAYELTFLVTDGPFAGTKITDKLWRTESQFCKDRLKLFAVRLGLVKRSADGKKMEAVAGKESFLDCLDAEAVLEVIREPDQKDPNKTWPRFAPMGIHDPANAKVKEILARGGKPIGQEKAGQGKGSDATAGKPAAEKPAAAPKKVSKANL